MANNVSKLTTNTERAIAAIQAKMRAAGMETAEGEPEEILRRMVQEREQERERIRRRDDLREAIARRVMQGLIILLALYMTWAMVRCTYTPSCPAYPFFRLFAGE